MAVTPVTGHKMKLYRNTGVVATPVWAEIAGVGDLSMPDFSLVAAELKRRGSNFTKALPGVFNMIAIEFRLVYGVDSTQMDALRTNFLAQTVEEWAVMNGAIATSDNEGLRIPILIEAFPWDQPLDDVSGFDVRAVCAYMGADSVDYDPVWYTVP